MSGDRSPSELYTVYKDTKKKLSALAEEIMITVDALDTNRAQKCVLEETLQKERATFQELRTIKCNAKLAYLEALRKK